MKYTIFMAYIPKSNIWSLTNLGGGITETDSDFMKSFRKTESSGESVAKKATPVTASALWDWVHVYTDLHANEKLGHAKLHTKLGFKEFSEQYRLGLGTCRYEGSHRYFPPSAGPILEWVGHEAFRNLTEAIANSGQSEQDEKASLAASFEDLIKQLDAVNRKLDAIQAENCQLRKEIDELKVLNVHPDPLAKARARGAAYKRAELENPENLTLEQAQQVYNRSTRMINGDRLNGLLYALIADGNTRGFRYPRWQFGTDPQRLRPILAALHAAKLSCWTMHQFFMRPNSFLNGQTPKDAIADPRIPIEVVSEAVHRQFAPEQGAT